MSDARDDELVPYEGDRGPVVIDLAEVRVAMGLPKNRYDRCKHMRLVYSDLERRVYCEDCKRNIEAFDAFMVLTRQFQAMLNDVRHRKAKVDAGLSATLIRRAAKSIDRTWGHKMAPCCPVCRAGLLPEDFQNGAASSVSIELARASRKRGK